MTYDKQQDNNEKYIIHQMLMEEDNKKQQPEQEPYNSFSKLKTKKMTCIDCKKTHNALPQTKRCPACKKKYNSKWQKEYQAKRKYFVKIKQNL